jgi:putative peptide zinc metalloprotease protein
VAFDFKLPAKPGPGDTQALAVNKKNGGILYNVAYALVTVSGGKPVTNTNGAFAFASCKACTTVAVSFQVVLIVGRSAVIAPIDAAGSLNVNCPACMTTAIADQIVVTLTKQPTKELVDEIESALQKLNALPALGANGTPAAVASQVAAVQQQVESTLEASGDLANPLTTTAATTTTATTTTTAETTTAPATTTSPAATAPATTAPTTTQSTTTAPTTTAPKTTTTTPTTTAETTTAPTTTTTPTTTEETTTTTEAPTTTAPTTTSGG